MKITKYVHSCLLLEDRGVTILTDPGNYTAQEEALDVGALEKLDYILITHEHQDHMHMPLIRQLKERFPHAKIISNPSVVELLKQEGIAALNAGVEGIEMEQVPHEKLLGGAAPQNVLFRIFGKLTHPGDSHHFSSSSEILALPIQAPWGSMVQGVEFAAMLKPKVVIPIHDWHWKDEARMRLYEMAEQYLRGYGITFKGIEIGQTVEV